MPQKFVIARYYFNSLFSAEADKSFIDDLMKEPYIEEKSFTYAIGNIKKEFEEGQEFIRGTFGRVRKGNFAEIYDKNTQEFKKQRIPDVADITLEFIISHKYHLILLEQSAVINPPYFIGKFIKIYSHTSTVAELVIDFILEEKDVYETIKTWERVEKVIFKKLRPSNPSSLDDFADIEKLLKETKSKNTNVEFNAVPAVKTEEEGEKDGGLDYESKLIKQGLALSSHGYGEARITGEKDNKKQEVETKKFYKKIEVDFYEDGALKKISQVIKEVAHEKDE